MLQKSKKLLVLFIFLLMCACSSSKPSNGYKIGIDPSFYPVELGLLEKNTYGFIQELLLEMAEVLNVKFFLFKASPVDLLGYLEKDKFDAVFSAKYPYNFERGNFNFSKVFLKTGPSLIVMKKSKYTSLDDMKDRLVGYVLGDEAVFLLEKHPQILLKTYEDIPTLLQDVQNGFLDGAVAGYLIGDSFAKNIYTDLKALEPLTEEGLRVLSLKSNSQITKLFDRGLEKLSSKGILQKLQKKWKLS